MNQIVYSMWPGETFLGDGAARDLGKHAHRLGGSRAFVVTDPGVREAGLLESTLAALDTAKVESVLFYDVEPNPTDKLVGLGVERFKESGCDLLVAVGGGSSIDTAKAVQLVAAGGGNILDYDLGLGNEVRPTPNNMVPLIAVPTTSGTGSEVTVWAVITDTRRNIKISVGDADLIPRIAVVDPEMMVTMPPVLTAATGIDALSHCLEAFVSPHENPLGDVLALYGIRLVAQNLRQAVEEGEDRVARRNMALASMVGGMSLNVKWCGACHSLAHQLSAEAGISHGVSIALMLPHQIEYSLSGNLGTGLRSAPSLMVGSGALLVIRASGNNCRRLRIRLDVPATVILWVGCPSSPCSPGW